MALMQSENSAGYKSHAVGQDGYPVAGTPPATATRIAIQPAPMNPDQPQARLIRCLLQPLCERRRTSSSQSRLLFQSVIPPVRNLQPTVPRAERTPAQNSSTLSQRNQTYRSGHSSQSFQQQHIPAARIPQSARSSPGQPIAIIRPAPRFPLRPVLQAVLGHPVIFKLNRTSSRKEEKLIRYRQNGHGRPIRSASCARSAEEYDFKHFAPSDIIIRIFWRSSMKIFLDTANIAEIKKGWPTASSTASPPIPA